MDGDLGGISMKGEIISTPHGFIGVEDDDIKNYKKEHIQMFRNVLGGDVDFDEIGTKFEKIKQEDEKIDVGDFMDDLEELNK